jgi:flagella basal body P-ring formation protein FlgA
MREQVTAWLARSLSCAIDDLRLSFEESQAEFLDSSSVGLTVSIRSLGASDKLSLAITTYRGDVIASATTVRVSPLIRREVAVAARRINRGDAISEDAISRDEQWVPPSVVPIGMDAIQGVIARSRIEAGTVLRPEHVDQPIAVKKGEIVTVDCVAGSVVVRAMARAMATAKEGEVIAFQYLESKRTFNARVNGPGRAVLVAVPENRGEDARDGESPQQAIAPAAKSQTKTHPKSESNSKLARTNGDRP